MSNNEPVLVFSTNQFAEAEILKNMLESEGISCYLDGEHQAGLTGILDIRGMVRAWDQDKAKGLLSRHHAIKTHGEPSMHADQPVVNQPRSRQIIPKH